MRLLSRLSPRVRKIVDWVVGLALIALGIVGLFVPILQGVLFIVMGLAVLSSHSKWARALLERVKSAGRRARASVQRRRRRGKRAGEADGAPRTADHDQG